MEVPLKSFLTQLTLKMEDQKSQKQNFFSCKSIEDQSFGQVFKGTFRENEATTSFTWSTVVDKHTVKPIGNLAKKNKDQFAKVHSETLLTKHCSFLNKCSHIITYHLLLCYVSRF